MGGRGHENEGFGPHVLGGALYLIKDIAGFARCGWRQENADGQCDIPCKILSGGEWQGLL